MPATLPETFGRYRILKKLGEGGMGAVYLAEDTRLRRKIALKVPHFREDEDPRVIERFYREARLAAQITHPNLCSVHDVDCVDDIHFLTMSFVEGTPLDRFVGPDRQWDPTQAVTMLRYFTGVLHLLHAQGIIHRDLKPANVMIRSDGTPVLMDFGLARSFEASSERLTTQGRPMGTPAFMAPEQVNGDEKLIGPHTDVWALGVMLYQMLTGQLPFLGPTPMEVWSRILFMQVQPPTSLRPELHPLFDMIAAHALAKDPAQRPATMRALDQLLASSDKQSLPQQQAVELTGDRLSIGSEIIVGTQHPPRLPTRDAFPTGPAYASPTQTAIPQQMTPHQRPSPLAMWGLGAVTLAGVAGVVLLVLVWLGVFPRTQQTTGSERAAGSSPKQTTLRLLPLEECALKEGEQRDITVRIEREGWDGEVTLVALDVPNQLQATVSPIPPGETTTSMRIRALHDAPATKYSFRLSARGRDTLRTDQVLTVIVSTTASPPVASLKLMLPSVVSVEAGKSESVIVAIERINFSGEVKLLSGDTPQGITLRLSPIADGQSRVNVQVEVGAAANQGEFKVGILARGPGKVEAEGTFTVRVTPAEVVLKKELTNSIGMKFMLIPKGTFQMGSSKADREKVLQNFKESVLKPEKFKEYLDREQPQHEVEITRPFYMGVYEVTQEEYEKVMKTNPSEFRKRGEYEGRVKDLDTTSFPVENVSWDDAVKFCDELNKIAKQKEEKCLYRLPTEAEWEYCCRGGATSLFSFGDTLTGKEANFDGKNTRLNDFPPRINSGGGFLGITVTEDEVNGAKVGEVSPGSPAEKGGLKKDDIIIAVDQKVIKDGPELIATIRARKLNDEVSLKVKREDKEMTLKVTLGKRPAQGVDRGNKGDYLSRPATVGSYAPNAWGLYDMHGNVWEWCSDWYGDYPSGKVTDPIGPDKGSNRVIRGGSWFNDARSSRAADRNESSPDLRIRTLGFRVVRVPTGTDK